jgi:sulfatase maturation enzyme AslB (radical SAM superfamily)
MKVVRYSKCNFRCKFCFLPKTYEDSKNISGTEEILLTGGEPFCDPNVFRILDICASRKISVQIQTNASVFYQKKNVDLLKRYSAIITEIMVGFHSHEPRSFSALTGTPYFPHVVKGIKNLSNSSLPLCLHHTMMQSNYKNSLQYLRFVRKEFPKIKRVLFSLVAPCGKALKNFTSVIPRITETTDIVNQCIEYGTENSIELLFPSCGIPGYPLCFLTKYQTESDLTSRCQGKKQKSTKEFQIENTKFHKCTICAFEGICCGIPKEYIKRYGDSEFF